MLGFLPMKTEFFFIQTTFEVSFFPGFGLWGGRLRIGVSLDSSKYGTFTRCSSAGGAGL